MGKREKQKNQRRHSRRGVFNNCEEEDDSSDYLPPTSELPLPDKEKELGRTDDDDNRSQEEENEEEEINENPSNDIPSKFLLYQQSVQSPKGDISYLQKFFLIYVGGRFPLHLQEDFCGTALLSVEWLRSDSRRTAAGLDLDLEALTWCMENNLTKAGADGFSRIALFHGNVLHPLESKLVKHEPQELIRNITLEENKEGLQDDLRESTVQRSSCDLSDEKYTKKNLSLPERDIICAFNYSCCCLHKRTNLVLYFKHVRESLSKKGGIFVMDLYGGTSSERKLRLQRRFPNFTYTWEQAEFDIIERKTRISLHFHLQKQQRKLRHAFSYSWRLWTLPEIRDCLQEAGFGSIHFWIRQMPETEEVRRTDGFGVGKDVKYEEMKSFQQQDAWNAYIVAIA